MRLEGWVGQGWSEASLEKKVGASGYTGGGMDQSGVSLGKGQECSLGCKRHSCLHTSELHALKTFQGLRAHNRTANTLLCGSLGVASLGGECLISNVCSGYARGPESRHGEQPWVCLCLGFTQHRNCATEWNYFCSDSVFPL